MRNNKFSKKGIELFTLTGIFFILSLSLISAYVSSNPSYTQPGMSSYDYLRGKGIDIYPVLNEEKCGAGQDFMVQIAPQGCTPSVVRSDLLEEQNVAVFCPLMATKLNPLIDVEAINYISFKGKYPEGITGIGFHPAQAALSNNYKTILNSPVLENIGYAVIVLKKTSNESAMPENIRGSVTANIKYDIQNAFGVGQAVYYLPEMLEDEWNENYMQYGFWKGKGYLKAESVGNDRAIVSVYLDKNKRLSTKNLKVGDTSDLIYVPGYYCLAGLKLRLDSLDVADSRALVNIDGDIYEVAQGEQFLDNKCKLNSLSDKGIIKEVTIKCDDDNDKKAFTLSIKPKIKLKVDGIEREYDVGEFIGSSGTESGIKYIYLGGARTSDNSNNVGKLDVYFVSYPKDNGKNLDDSEISKIGIASKQGIGAVVKLYSGLATGEKYEKISYGSSADVFGKTISVEGFGGVNDLGVNSEFEDYFKRAKINYEKIINDFPNEKIDGLETTYSEKALVELIELASSTSQMKTMVELCGEFNEKYLESIKEISTYCTNDLKKANTEPDSVNLVIDGKTKTISFEGLNEPEFKDYGAVMSVSGAEQGYNQNNIDLVKKQQVFVSNGEFFQLDKVGEDYIEISGRIKNNRGNLNNFNEKIKLNEKELLGDTNYQVSVHSINLKKVAKVSVVPDIRYAETEANFTFNIGIEKRAIQLSPEKINSKIKNLDNQIAKWAGISDKLNKLTKGLKTGCFAYGTYITVRNLLNNMDGKSIARQEIMRAKGGWYDYCEKQMEKDTSLTMDKCLYDNAEKIDADVQKLSKIIDTQNEGIKKIETYKETLLNGREVDDEKFMSVYPDAVLSDLEKLNLNEFGTSKEELEKIITKSSYDNGNFYKEDLRDAQRYARVLSDTSLKGTKLYDVAKTGLTNKLNEIKGNSEKFVELGLMSDKWNGKGFSNLVAKTYGSKESKSIPYDNGVASQSNSFGLKTGTPVQLISFNNQEFLLELELVNNKNYRIVGVYDTDGKLVENSEIMRTFSNIKKYDETSYENVFSKESAKARYYETEPYKGYPAVVPFDLNNGWYAAIKQTLGLGGAIKAYDESGKVTSFWLCNVGKDKKQDFFNDLKDDECEMIVLQGGRYIADFPGLDEAKTSDLVDDAIKAINQAHNQYSKGVRQITINTKRGKYVLDVGNPAVNIPEMQCQDFMSPTECHTLFNLCDPVICPSSRCNLGGTYYVDDVIQSGIIGGLTLCLPNQQEGIAFPVCLSGINAGVENLLSMSKSYKDCLQESLDTGKTVGICDEVHSIYLCEFLWRQVTPMSGVLIPKLLEIATGKRVKGGGEYLGIQSAWNNAENSVNYLINYYGANSWKAFKSRSTQSAGTEVCKNFISVVGPKTSDLVDALTEPDSPSQYTAWFEEIPFTTATNPPISQYKVFYHIYSGKDIGAYYRVYLKTPTGGSLYQSNPTILVASGYSGIGEYATETKDFTASSGYQQLCVVINSQEECGFKQVSTDYALNLIKDKYVGEQASQTEIKTETSCVSGTSSVYSFLNPNLEEGASDYINPNLYNYGVVRICATDNPGLGTDANVGTNLSRWVSVGYCGNTKIKCWLDTKSVKDVVKNKDVESGILSDTANAYVNAITKEGTYLAEDSQIYVNAIEKFKELIGSIGEKIFMPSSREENDVKNVVSDADSVYGKVIMSSQKVSLLGYSARALNGLGRLAYAKEISERDVKETEEQQKKEYAELDKEKQNKIKAKYKLEDDEFNAILKITKCDDCGKDRHWYTLGLGNKCSLNQCLAIGENLARNCVYVDGECTEGFELPKSDLSPKANDKTLLERLAKYDFIIKEASLKYGVSENMIKAIISQESDAVENVTDGLGSYGLMQVSDDAAKDVLQKYADSSTSNAANIYLFSTKGKYVADSNIKLGTAYYKILFDYYSQWNPENESKIMALAAYNWGIGNVNEHCKKEFISGYVWENCKLMDSVVLQYVSNVLGYERAFKEKYAAEAVAPTKDISTGYSFLTAADIAPYWEKQKADVNSDVLNFVDCIGKDYLEQTSKYITVTSLTDNNLYRLGNSGKSLCDLNNGAEEYNSKTSCVHTKGSCHYYLESGEVKSRAVDIRLTGVYDSLFTESFGHCKDSLNNNAILIKEATHYHISINGCDSVGDKKEAVEQGVDAGRQTYETDLEEFIGFGKTISQLAQETKDKKTGWKLNKGTGSEKNLISRATLLKDKDTIYSVNLLKSDGISLLVMRSTSSPNIIKLELAHPHTKETFLIQKLCEDVSFCEIPLDERLFGNLKSGDLINYRVLMQESGYYEIYFGDIKIISEKEDIIKNVKLIKITDAGAFYDLDNLDLNNMDGVYLRIGKTLWTSTKSFFGAEYNIKVDLKKPSGEIITLYTETLTSKGQFDVSLSKQLFESDGVYEFIATMENSEDIDIETFRISINRGF